MTPDDRDLQPLDPAGDPLRWERMVGSIMAAAQPELERRAVTRSPLLLLTEWFRPTMAASAAVAAFALSALLLGGEVRQAESTEEVRIVAEGIGIPGSLADWLDTGGSEALDELVFGFEGETP